MHNKYVFSVSPEHCSCFSCSNFNPLFVLLNTRTKYIVYLTKLSESLPVKLFTFICHSKHLGIRSVNIEMTGNSPFLNQEKQSLQVFVVPSCFCHFCSVMLVKVFRSHINCDPTETSFSSTRCNRKQSGGSSVGHQTKVAHTSSCFSVRYRKTVSFCSSSNIWTNCIL